jgi:4a-hydroxytetrahydrobiopterin dehydratase
MRILTDEEIKEGLKRLDGWSHIENHIEKKYEFEDFVWSLHFLVGRGSSDARDMKHYPEYLIHDNEVTIRCWTREAGGLTELDFVLAERIDASTKPKE